MAKAGKEKERRKIYRADDFAVSAMFCPGCRAIIEKAVEQCPRCDYSGRKAVEKFAFEAPKMERYLDPKKIFSGSDRELIDQSLAALSKRFPQPRFCFCIVDLENDTDPREFGFWLMNASPIADPEEQKLRPWTILIVIDDANGRVSLTSGYAVEPFLNEERWSHLLRQEKQFFFSRNYGTAILRFVDGAIGVLSEGAERTERRLDSQGSGKGESKRKWLS